MVSSLANTAPGLFSLCETRNSDEAFRDLTRSLGFVRDFALRGPESRYQLRRRSAQLGPVGFFHGTNTGYDLKAASSDKLILIMTTRGTCQLKSGKAEATTQPTRQAVLTPQDSFSAHLEPGIEGYMLSFSAAELAQRSNTPLPPGIAEMDLTKGRGEALSRAVHFVGGSLLNGLPPGPLALASCGDMLLHLVMDALEPLAQAAPATLPSAAVRRAMEYIDAHCLDPLTIDQIAAISGVTARRLQAGFRAHMGLPPLAYMKQRRLRAARAMLLSGGPITVTETAVACGFLHLSEFAKSYREAFGELPSHMLNRRPG